MLYVSCVIMLPCVKTGQLLAFQRKGAMNVDTWQEVRISINREAAEAAYAVLGQLGIKNLAVEDSSLVDLAEEQGWGDYFPETTHSKQVTIVFYFPVHRSPQELTIIQERLQALGEVGLDPGSVELRVKYIHERDWATAWKAYYHTERYGRVVIQPSWKEDDSHIEIQPDDIVIQLDPGMAFGTGTHPTTEMCIEFLQELTLENRIVWDIGTGSGILSITAAKLGAEVQAVDIDPVAVRVAQENRDLNDVQFPVRQGSVEKLTGRPYIVIANIIADVILELLPEVYKAVQNGGFFVAAGVIEGRDTEVEESALKLGFRTAVRQQNQEWVGFVFQKE
jgi:ribosomal protein L11 methyltransferase